MFTSARLKLTGWYLLIIMSVSLLFSLVVYHSLTEEISRGMRLQAVRALSGYGLAIIPPDIFVDLDTEIFNEARNRVALDLVILNSGILLVSGFLSFFLAGKTLQPIEQMVEDQKRFVADASHEFRTPLTALKTQIEVALRSRQLKAAEVRELLDSNLEEVNKIQVLSNYLLNLNRYTNRTGKFPVEPVNLSELIGKTVKSLRPLADSQQISLVINTEDLSVSGNIVGLTELITILLDNAIKYSHRGGKVIIGLVKESRNAVLSVQDFGVGIKASDIPNIFHRFFRADPSRNKDSRDGYGLGLSIAKNIVELHHGNISVSSSVGSGSVFLVKLPLSRHS